MTPTEDFETITVRLPKALKAMTEQFAEARGSSLTALVREALQETVAPSRRFYELPGLSKSFQDFCEGIQNYPLMVLVVNDRDGSRTFFEGRIERNLTSESVLTLEAKGGKWVIPKRDVVGWFPGNVPALMNQMAINLRRLGWVAAGAYY